MLWQQDDEGRSEGFIEQIDITDLPTSETSDIPGVLQKEHLHMAARRGEERNCI